MPCRPGRARGPRVLGLAGFCLLLAADLMTPHANAAAQVFLSRDEALALAFPKPATVERRTAFLSEEDLAEARRLAGPGIDVNRSVVSYYVGRVEGRPVGVAYFDVHRVRTRPEAVMVVVRPDGRIGRIEILRFQEPPEYRAPVGWLRQFRDRVLGDALSLKRGVVGITGASLTSRAIVQASRRVLALHEVIRPLSSMPEDKGA